jgi:hypothetical protein
MIAKIISLIFLLFNLNLLIAPRPNNNQLKKVSQIVSTITKNIQTRKQNFNEDIKNSNHNEEDF